VQSYQDSDGDGYGQNTPTGSRCIQSGGYNSGYSATNNDCCDSDSGANPGNAASPQDPYGSSSSLDACGSYDWNCDGSIETPFPTNDLGTACATDCYDGWVYMWTTALGCGGAGFYLDTYQCWNGATGGCDCGNCTLYSSNDYSAKTCY
jgi:hypothetical protein